jgi:hypothetical protein
MLALGAALSANCFVRAFGIAFLGRPRSSAAAEARETDTLSRASMLALFGLCIAVGILPGLVIDVIAPVTQGLFGARMPAQGTHPWLSIVPIANSRSSYNGLLIFGFIVISTIIAAELIHRFASRAVRRGPVWDCGYPDASPAAQYTADSFAQPVRRVFGDVFVARETVDMPAPGDPRPARLDVRVRDLIWECLYAPVGGWIEYAAEKLNHLQFLTIRRYLGLVFGALVALLFMVAIWA